MRRGLAFTATPVRNRRTAGFIGSMLSARKIPSQFEIGTTEMSATLELTQNLFAKYEGELKALEARKLAAQQNLLASQQTQAELAASIASAMAELQRTRDETGAVLERGNQILADAQRDANAIRVEAQREAEALRRKGLAAVETAQRAFQGLS